MTCNIPTAIGQGRLILFLDWDCLVSVYCNLRI
jgi:hypothetical protein